MFWEQTLGVSLPDPALLVAEGASTRILTDEAALWAGPGDDLRVEALVEPGTMVAQGAPVLRLRHQTAVTLCAPMPAQVATLELGPGHRLREMRFFHEPAAGRHMFATQDARQDDAALRVLMQGAGIWPQIRSRPFGRLPTTDEAPAAIFVMLLDARPGAPCPGAAVKDRTPDLEAGLDALCRLTPGPVFLCQSPGAETVGMAGRKANLRLLKTALHYPRALPGFLAHQHFPALPDRPIWDIHGEDAAGLGMLLRSGMIPETRRVRIGGPALTRSLTVDCQPGADLRGLCQGLVAPGAHRLLTGPAMGGNPARWLGTRDRQVCALPDMAAPRRDHWFFAALRRAARPLPLIPTAALEQAMGGVLPAMPFLRALSAGDQETAQRLGALSFLEEDLALADYISGAKPPLSSLLRVLLDRVAAERQT